VGALPYMARGHKLTPLFRLTFRRSSLQHPLLAGALGGCLSMHTAHQHHQTTSKHRHVVLASSLTCKVYLTPAWCLWVPGRIAEDRGNCELIAKEEVAVQQLVLMALSENPVVVKQACKTIGGWWVVGGGPYRAEAAVCAFIWWLQRRAPAASNIASAC
jgi:hypothetical protein